MYGYIFLRYLTFVRIHVIFIRLCIANFLLFFVGWRSCSRNLVEYICLIPTIAKCVYIMCNIKFGVTNAKCDTKKNELYIERCVSVCYRIGTDFKYMHTLSVIHLKFRVCEWVWVFIFVLHLFVLIVVDCSTMMVRWWWWWEYTFNSISPLVAYKHA